MALTLQQIYNKVKRHLLRQNKKSESNGSCLYRGPDGTKCAVGCLIPDKLYDQSLESKNIHDFLVRETVAKSLGPRKKKLLIKEHNLLSEMQGIHDSEDPSSWKERLKVLAVKNGLKP